LFRLGFIVGNDTKTTPSAEAEVTDRENKLLLKIWNHLKGKYRGYVRMDNIKVYLAAIMNLHQSFMFISERKGEEEGTNKSEMIKYVSNDNTSDSFMTLTGSNVFNSPSREFGYSCDRKSAKKTSFSSVGVFSTKGKFYFRDGKEIRKIHSYYSLLSTQRYKYTTGSSSRSLSNYSKSSSSKKIYYKPYEEPVTQYFGKKIYKDQYQRKISRERTKSKRTRPLEKVNLPYNLHDLGHMEIRKCYCIQMLRQHYRRRE
jgi:hypothetical protein